MGDTLKAGGLGSAAAGGTPPEFAASMAQAMELALNELLIAEGRDTVSTENTTETRDRRILFVAIARGIVRHLSANHDAFDVVRDDDGTALSQHRVTIKTRDQ
jgi:hypothetical protein